MAVSRLLSYPVILIKRELSGDEDEWGSPLTVDTRIATNCYYRLVDSTDPDDNAMTTTDTTVEVFLAPDSYPGPYDAVELDFVGELEVIGQPAPELNARTGKVSHLKLTARKARV
jgi:hypothetical protein